jgi:hypothetical protein
LRNGGEGGDGDVGVVGGLGIGGACWVGAERFLNVAIIAKKSWSLSLNVVCKPNYLCGCGRAKVGT